MSQQAGAQTFTATYDPPPPRVAVVVVTYNRRDLLLRCMAAVHQQTRRPDEVIVVDNASTDGTADSVAAEYPSVVYAALARNTGGAGGFAVGASIALSHHADLVWIMDDDTVPQPGALQALLEARILYPGLHRPALIASRVRWVDGRHHPMNTPRSRPFASRQSRADAAAIGCTPIRSASFVSILVDASSVRRLGLPRADYFLWNDDFEFTTRLLRHDVGLLCPASVVVHETATFGAADVDPGERFFYEVRNKMWTLTAPGTLGVRERALYTVSTLRRWVRTFRGSRDVDVLGRALARGVVAGVRTKPRATADLLTELGYGDDSAGP